jgi:hypothetical protein
MDISDISTDKLVELLEENVSVIDELMVRLVKCEEENEELRSELEELMQG